MDGQATGDTRSDHARRLRQRVHRYPAARRAGRQRRHR